MASILDFSEPDSRDLRHSEMSKESVVGFRRRVHGGAEGISGGVLFAGWEGGRGNLQPDDSPASPDRIIH